MKARGLEEILDRDPAFGQLKAYSDTLAPLQRAWQEALPAALHPHALVAGKDGSSLVIHVTSQAVSARLRQLSPSLLQALASAQPGIEALHFRVMPALLRTGPTPRQASPLTPESLDHFERLAARLPDSSLKNAILHLLQHHKR